MEEAVIERRKVFAAAHTSDKDCQDYISASRHTSSVIGIACDLALLSHLNLCTLSVLWLTLLPPLLTSQLFLFRESASVHADYLRSHFSLFQPKACQRLPFRATSFEESHSSYFPSAKFLAAASNFSSFTATGPDKLACHMLKHLPRSGMDFLSRIFNLC